MPVAGGLQGMKVTSVGIKELKAKLSSYVDRVRSGERVIITEHGQEVAVIIPLVTLPASCCFQRIRHCILPDYTTFIPGHNRAALCITALPKYNE